MTLCPTVAGWPGAERAETVRRACCRQETHARRDQDREQSGSPERDRYRQASWAAVDNVNKCIIHRHTAIPHSTCEPRCLQVCEPSSEAPTGVFELAHSDFNLAPKLGASPGSRHMSPTPRLDLAPLNMQCSFVHHMARSTPPAESFLPPPAYNCTGPQHLVRLRIPRKSLPTKD